jgi:glycosyltransferase involved in cell wall biosynthesis
VFALILVVSIYSFALMLAYLRGRSRPESSRPIRRLAVIGTFYNRGWFLSHATPLARSGIEELFVVTDEPQTPVERVRFLCPAPWAVSLCGRTIAKLVSLLFVGLRYRPDLYIGYHIMPCAVMALIAARLFGRPASYQMTGGPVEVTGGAESENAVLRRLGRSGRRVQALAVRLIREFDQVVVRGTGARRFLVARGIAETAIAIIPGSVDPLGVQASGTRPYELVFVGRLVELKQPLQFVEVLAAVSHAHQSVRALVVGDGPLLSAMRECAVALGVAKRLEFAGRTDRVQSLLAGGRIFVLTSRSEGLSIAMAEAMMAGLVPVVANVGDLGDLVHDGVNGYLVDSNDIAGYVQRIRSILGDPALWARLSAAATISARGHVGLDHVTGLWRTHLEAVSRRFVIDVRGDPQSRRTPPQSAPPHTTVRSE